MMNLAAPVTSRGNTYKSNHASVQGGAVFDAFATFNSTNDAFLNNSAAVRKRAR
jgi:hypothetical protein